MIYVLFGAFDEVGIQMCVQSNQIISTYIYIYIHKHTHTHTHIYIYIYIYIYVIIQNGLSAHRHILKTKPQLRYVYPYVLNAAEHNIQILKPIRNISQRSGLWSCTCEG